MHSKLVPLISSTVACSALALASGAAAQVVVRGSVGVSAGVIVPPPPPPPPPPPQPVIVVQEPAPQPVYVAQPRTVYVAQPRPVYVAQPGYVVGPQPYLEDRPRFRFGVDVGGGWLVFGPRLGGPAINFGVRAGVQISNLFAVYYQGNLPIGFAAGDLVDARGERQRAFGVAAALTNTVAAEFTLWHILHLGIGPSLDYFFGGVCANAATCYGTAGVFFGANARIAATFGAVEPGRRRSFSVGADLHPTFTPVGVSFFATLNLGYEFH